MTEPDLVALHVGIVARDPDALVAFEQLMRPLVLGWLRSKGAQEADADVAWNAAFLTVVGRAGSLSPLGTALRPFTMRVAHNQWVSHVRSVTRRDEVPVDETTDVAAGSASGTSLTAEQVEHVHRCLEEAPLSYRAVIEFVSRGLTTAEISQLLEKTEANAQKLRQRARAWFSRCLEGIFDA